MERGSVSLGVYFYYATNFGLGMALISCIMCGLYAGFNIGANFCLSDWAESGLKNNVSKSAQSDLRKTGVSTQGYTLLYNMYYNSKKELLLHASPNLQKTDKEVIMIMM